MLILSALLLWLSNRREDAWAGREAAYVLSQLESALETQGRETAEAAEPEGEGEQAGEKELPVKVVDGYGYIGYVEIPALERELPVMSQWDYERLKIAPCRQAGSSYTDDLVIAAHNYKSQFGGLKNLEAGDTVIFTDMNGVANTYRVEKRETIEPEDVDAVLNSGYDLVLYTCTLGGETRVAVFCERAEEGF